MATEVNIAENHAFRKVLEDTIGEEKVDRVLKVIQRENLAECLAGPQVLVADRNILRDVVEDVVRETMVDQVPEAIQEASQPEWLSREQVKDRYGFTDRQLIYMRNNRSIEFSQHGRRIFYRRESLEQWFEEGRVETRRGDE